MRSLLPMRPGLVLVVDDYQDTREIVREVLCDAGYEVLEADNGKEALATANVRVPDLILLDLSLPGLDGWQVAQRLRANPRTSAVPIIALTAHSASLEHDRALTAGCSAVVVKPCYPDDIVAAVQRYATGPMPQAI
jgi:two-component system, cell cycle response regulator DivK